MVLGIPLALILLFGSCQCNGNGEGSKMANRDTPRILEQLNHKNKLCGYPQCRMICSIRILHRLRSFLTPKK